MSVCSAWWNWNAQELSTGPNYPGNISEDLKAILWRKTSEYYRPNDMAENWNKFCTYRKGSKVKTTRNIHWNFFLKPNNKHFFTSESTLHVSQVYSIRRFRMGCKEHNRENALTKVIKCNEDNTVLLCKVTIRASGPDLET